MKPLVTRQAVGAGTAAQVRKLARLGASDVEYGPCERPGMIHAKVHAPVGRASKEFDCHHAPNLERALDALIEVIEDERRKLRRRKR